MKKIMLFLCLLPCFVLAQELSISEAGLPIKDGLVVYERIVDVKGVKKKDIYAASKKWITDNFNSSKAVIQTEDNEAGQLIGNGTTTVKVSEKSNYYKIEFKFQIDCKDDKYRIRFYKMNIISIMTGILSADLHKTNSIIPLEMCAFFPAERKFSQKDIENGKMINGYINNHFTLLLNNFNSSVKWSSADIF